MIALALPATTTDEGFVAPTIDDTHYRDIFPWGGEYGVWFEGGFGKQMLMIILSVIFIAIFFIIASRKGKLVPGKMQFLGESAYGFVRNSIGKDIIGGKDFMKYVPWLFTAFFFVLVNNIFGAIPFLQLPSFSHPGSAYAIAGIFYLLWVGIGIKKHGLRYFKLAVVPSGVPWYILPIVVPIEIISNFLVRPVTHSLRLFATMLAGHLIITLAGSAIEYMVLTGNILLQGTSVLVLVGAVSMYMLEVLIMILQAYVFTLLAAIYIEGALHADAH
ncbi:F-type H+-transporting ATPase subunit a [Arthrobacter sp. CAN_A212]|uniref:F0F1 ATP synthase subunit A n=1 Tax=unclassified Arthrobacter TaxID=235627 RepID=UPI0018C8DC59|nr:F0F1 ATP synthase subunit A [Arthrobacter sp. CAN_C5]MBP2216144.1 F-type H+-transporting ATPase subunit a [Arthrobacter sp. CAN_C5]